MTIPCRIAPLHWGDDPGHQIAEHMAYFHDDELITGLEDDTTEHLARLTNDASDRTQIDPLLILARSENYLNDWTR